MSASNNETKGSLVEADEPFVAIKSEAGRWWKLPKPPLKPPSLMRRSARAAAIYALSYMAVKALDKARKEYPGNQAISGVDDIAHAFFYFENLIVGGAVAVIKTGYDAMSSPQPLPEQAASTPISPPIQNDEGKSKAEPKKLLKHKNHSNRANLNAALTPDIPPIANSSKVSADAAWNAHLKADVQSAIAKSPPPIP